MAQTHKDTRHLRVTTKANSRRTLGHAARSVLVDMIEMSSQISVHSSAVISGMDLCSRESIGVVAKAHVK